MKKDRSRKSALTTVSASVTLRSFSGISWQIADVHKSEIYEQ